MELQGICKAVNLHFCCYVQQHTADLHPANHHLPHSSDFTLPDLLVYLSDIHCDRSLHAYLCIVPLFLIPPLRNGDNRESIGWLGGWEWLSFLVVIREFAVKAFFNSINKQKLSKSPNHWELTTPLPVNHINQTPQGLHSLTYKKQSHMFKIKNGLIFRFSSIATASKFCVQSLTKIHDKFIGFDMYFYNLLSLTYNFLRYTFPVRYTDTPHIYVV